MDSCQLIRKETKMDVVHLTQKQLAARWSISEATLERRRSEGLGPKFLKLCGRVLYRHVRPQVSTATMPIRMSSTKPPPN